MHMPASHTSELHTPSSDSGRIVIPVDGAAKTGKGEVAAELAGQLTKKYGVPFIPVSSGTLYRAVAYTAIRMGLIDRAALEREKAGLQLSEAAERRVSALARSSRFEFKLGPLQRQRALFKDCLPSVRIFCDQHDLTDAVGSNIFGNAASIISRIPAAKQALSGRLRTVLAQHHIIIDGRDMCRVFADAKLKVRVTAPEKDVVGRLMRSLYPRSRRGTHAWRAREAAIVRELSLRRKSDAVGNPHTADDAFEVNNPNGGVLSAVAAIIRAAEQKGVFAGLKAPAGG